MRTDKLKKLIAFMIIVTMSLGIMFTWLPYRTVRADSTGTIINVSQSLNVRQAPSNQSDSVASINLGKKVTVLSTVNADPGDESGFSRWCLITFKQSGNEISGYVPAYYVQITPGDIQSDAAFEDSIASFPDSYKPYLRALHQEHPLWTFTPVDTGMKWADALNREVQPGVSLVPSSSNREWLSLASHAYDPNTDAFTVIDAPNWVNASRALVAYYMDPRNQLNSYGIFQFLDLSYVNDDSVPVSAIEGVLSDTFMASDRGTATSLDGQEMAFADVFAQAGNISNVNPIFLAARVRQECGVNGSTSSDGATGYYNFYNIGAYSDVYSASMLGLRFAELGNGDAAFNERYLIPWNSQGRSITGGALWIANYYVNAGQNSIYFMRFNFSPSSSYDVGTHQYMTATQSANSEAGRMYTAFERAGLTESALNFAIPVYSSMPGSCPLPAANNAAADLVKASIRVALDRSANSDEIKAYSSDLRSGQPAAEVLARIAFCDEAVNRNLDDNAFVSMSCRMLTGIAPDEGTVNQYASMIQNGFSRKYVFSLIANCEETRQYLNLHSVIPGTYYSDDPSDVERSIEAFVSMLYTNILDREADTAGLNYWKQRISEGMSGPQAVAQFYLSNEFGSLNVSNSNYIAELYQQFLSRDPDQEGFNVWMNYLEHGYSRKYVIAGFVNSEEFGRICTNYGVRTDCYVPEGPEYELVPNEDRMGDFIIQLYSTTLNRMPEEDGYSYWVNAIMAGEVSGYDVAHGFIFSDEMISKELSDEDFVAILYHALMGHAPDSAGFEYWVGYLSDGASREEVFSGFAQSDEFTRKCIVAGFLPYAGYVLGM